jgi:membrane protein implicated in regulation of membrane protease activity
MILNVWWVWLAAAAVLAILELLVPVYVFSGFAVGAAVVGVAMWMGLDLSWPWLLLICGLVALVAWLGLRAAMGVRKGQVKVWDRDINED